MAVRRRDPRVATGRKAKTALPTESQVFDGVMRAAKFYPGAKTHQYAVSYGGIFAGGNDSSTMYQSWLRRARAAGIVAKATPAKKRKATAPKKSTPIRDGVGKAIPVAVGGVVGVSVLGALARNL